MTLNESVNAPVPLVERPMSDTAAHVRPRGRSSAGADDGMLGLGLLAGPANVIMQLARPAVGYGVLESRVESGRVDRHPIKRARTTFTYLAVSTNGTEKQKAAFRRAVNGAHAQVFSTDESPVEYHAFDKDLQLWVGACLYKGVVDVHRLFIGEMDDETADRVYLQGRALATMLQVPESMWPVDRAAFDRYWQAALDDVHIDDTVREYLVSDRDVTAARGDAAWSAATTVGRGGVADHHGVPAATFPRGDAASVGSGSAAQVRQTDGGTAHRQQRLAQIRASVPVQRSAQGRRQADPHRPTPGLARRSTDCPTTLHRVTGSASAPYPCVSTPCLCGANFSES